MKCWSWISMHLIINLYWYAVIISVILANNISLFTKMSLYGKLRSKIDREWTVPKQWFAHFYVIALFWSLLLFMDAVSESKFIYHAFNYIQVSFSAHFAPSCKNMRFVEIHANPLPLALLVIHCMKRGYESYFVNNTNSVARMHICGYILGISYYIAAPWTIYYNESWSDHTVLKIAGIALFILGSYRQHEAHRILGSLRTDSSSAYKIPYGGWFHLVSSPHYLAEIILYVGLLMILQGRGISLYLMLVFIILNLTTSAIRTHAWYKAKFKDYPQERNAIVPYVL